MTTQDKRERERRGSEYYGFVAIILGLFALFVAAVRNDENSWQGLLLAGISFALGAFFLVRALRTGRALLDRTDKRLDRTSPP